MKLFIALPTTHGVMQTQFLPGIMDWFRDRSIETTVYQYIDPYIVLARNTAVADFLQTDCTHLLFIDADIVFRKEQILRLLSHDVDIVGGLYPKKAQGKIKWVCNALPDRPPPEENGLIKLKHIGTGFMLIRRRVFVEMIGHFGDEIAYLEDEIDRELWNFFPMGIVDRRMLSEDWFFCNRARELGFVVYGDTVVLLKHIGTVVFPLETQIKESSNEDVHADNRLHVNAAG
jgi:hypothetical protein